MKYKKDGITVEAFEWTVEWEAEYFRGAPWMLEAFEMAGSGVGGARIYIRNGEKFMEIKTATGIMRADSGDYIIRENDGRLHVCMPGAFEATYEKVET